MSIMRSVALVAIWDFFFIAIAATAVAAVAAVACLLLLLLISHGVWCTFYSSCRIFIIIFASSYY